MSEFSDSQKQFISFLEDNIKANKRIIGYTFDSFFGVLYAIKKFGNLKKFKTIIDFEDLIYKSAKDIKNPVLKISASILSLLIYFFTGYKVNIQAALNNIASSGALTLLEKELPFLKFLRFNHRLNKQKMRKIINIVYIKDYSKLDFKKRRILDTLIEKIMENKIANTLVIIAQPHKDMGNFQSVIQNIDNIPHFTLTDNDKDFFVKKFFKDKKPIPEVGNLMQKLGLRFVKEYQNAILSLNNETNNEDELMNDLILKMLQFKSVDYSTIKHTLTFSSLFSEPFNSFIISNFDNNKFDGGHLSLAAKASVLLELNNNSYKYLLPAFKAHFYEKYKQTVPANPELVFQYILKNKPFDYISLINVLKLFYESNIKQIDEIFIKAYFFAYKFGAIYDLSFIKAESYAISSYAKIFIDLFEAFSQNNIRMIQDFANQLFLKTKNNFYDPITQCIIFGLLLQIKYEDLGRDIEWNDLLDLLKNNLIRITQYSNTLYDKFWRNYFTEIYLTCALENETFTKANERFFADIYSFYEDVDNKNYAEKNNLPFINRTVLLANNLNTPEEAKKIFLTEYNRKENSLMFKELLRINGSVSHILLGEYKEAEKLLIDKPNIELIKNINMDTYRSYQNNLLLASYHAGKMSLQNFIKKSYAVFNGKSSDNLIVANNIIAAYLLNNEYDDAVALMNDIYHSCDEYHIFYLKHNLCAYYFTQGDKEKLKTILQDINIPTLLKRYSSFFRDKFHMMLKNCGSQKEIEYASSDRICKHYKNLFLFGSIERWFE